MILFNEANLCNLLETTLFNGDACSSVSSQALDLTDYCVRHLTHIVSEEEDPNANHEQELSIENKKSWCKEETVCEEIRRHERTTYFQVSSVHVFE